MSEFEGKGLGSGAQVVKNRLAELKPGEPLTCGNVSVLPLFTGNGHKLPYLLLHEAIESGVLTVTEVSEGGSVPELKVENKGDKPVLILAGGELRGAKQNRIVNATIIVSAKSTLLIPVSCVEQHRWSYRGRMFRSGRHASSEIRHKLQKTVHENIKRMGVHRSDQIEIWESVRELHQKNRVNSPTGSMSDSFDQQEERLSEFRKRLKYPAKATGLAVFINGKLRGIELFEHPQILKALWDSEIESYAIDAIGSDEPEPLAAKQKEQFTECARRVGESLEPPRKSLGAGIEIGIEHAGLVGAALVNDDKVVHLQAFVDAA